MSPVLNINILQWLLLIVPNPLKQRTNLFFNLILLWFGCHACRCEIFYSNWTSCNGSSTSNRTGICSTKKIVAEVNVPSYPVISFIIFYQVKWQGKHASIGELPRWTVLFIQLNPLSYFDIFCAWYYNLRIVIWMILIIQWYIVLSFIQWNLLFKLHPVGVQWQLNFKSDRDM